MAVEPSRERVARRRRTRRQRDQAIALLLVLVVGFLLHKTGYTRFLIPKGWIHTQGEDPAGLEDPNGGNTGDSSLPGTDGPGDGGDTGGTDGPGNPGSSEGSDPIGPSNVLSQEELQAIKPNELGKIPIIMYHVIGSTDGEWERSRDNFRNDLQTFYDLGYSLIPLNDYLNGDISAPSGRAPLVLTFDDATSGQFTMIESDIDGRWIPDPDCAVGMLLAFSETHPEFGHAATFFVDFPAPFGDADRVKENLTFLVEHGMEIGNHTYNHQNLDSVSAELVVKEVGSLANKVRELCGYEPLSLALPYGGYPKSEEGLASGEWQGQGYTNLGVLLVGAEPAPSPFSSKFSPLAIPRIRGSQDELDKWLGNFERYPEGRFISDGQASTVTVREGEETQLDPTRTEDREVRIYAPSPDIENP